jgi:hypothetical protein
MAKKNLIYEAIHDFYLGGQYIPAGATVTHGHELLKGRTKLFRPFVPTYGDIEGAELPELPEPKPAPPAKPEEKAQAAADQKAMTDEGDSAKAKANAEGEYHPAAEKEKSA